MASDIWLRTILIVRKETRCRHIGYSFQLTARVILYALSHRQDSTYHGMCYPNRGDLSGTRNSSMGPPWMIDPTTHCTMSERSYHGATSRSSHTQITPVITSFHATHLVPVSGPPAPLCQDRLGSTSPSFRRVPHATSTSCGLAEREPFGWKQNCGF